jgi:hypothetical protein
MNYPGARLARRFQRHPRRSGSARHETDAPTGSRHGRSDPLVLCRQQCDLAQSTRSVCEMRVLITGHLGFIGATSPAACHQCHRDRRGRSRVSKNVSSRRNMADA